MQLDWHRTVEFVKRDWHSHPVRLCLEIINWLLNLLVALTFTLTVPNVPLLIVYPMFFFALSISIYSAISRGSFGLLITSITILIVDLLGYIKLLMQ